MQIRTFLESDEAAVIALWNEVFGYTAAHNEAAEVIRRKLALDRDLFFVAVQEGAIVGTVMGGYDGHRGWIYAVAVSEPHRGRGTGTALVRHVEQALRALGCPKINLQVLGTNSGAVRFYEKLGYSVEERISMGKIV